VIAQPDPKSSQCKQVHGNGRDSLCDSDEEAQQFQRAIFLFNIVASIRGTVAVKR
jgi:hypothetical protein